MILKTFDGQETYVTREQADKIAQAIANGTKMISVSGMFLAAGAIATIKPGGQPPKLNVPRIGAPTRTEEEKKARCEHNREKLAAMKADLIAKGVLKA